MYIKEIMYFMFIIYICVLYVRNNLIDRCTTNFLLLSINWFVSLVFVKVRKRFPAFQLIQAF